MWKREEIQRLKATNPDISHREAFSAAAKNEKQEQKKGGKKTPLARCRRPAKKAAALFKMKEPQPYALFHRRSRRRRWIAGASEGRNPHPPLPWISPLLHRRWSRCRCRALDRNSDQSSAASSTTARPQDLPPLAAARSTAVAGEPGEEPKMAPPRLPPCHRRRRAKMASFPICRRWRRRTKVAVAGEEAPAQDRASSEKIHSPKPLDRRCRRRRSTRPRSGLVGEDPLAKAAGSSLSPESPEKNPRSPEDEPRSKADLPLLP
ncbi:Axial regulator YABBY 1 [Platanthera zijinensis]|uniref:Axial regulator YABBY 1 n=1 Tax=Platanthera zijinensis TaxID=2320716 RepID=A0AAP0G6H1_9ASPA